MEFNVKKCYVLDMRKSAMRPPWMYRLGQNIISMEKKDKNSRVVIQDNLSPEKHIDRTFGDIFGML